MWPVASAAGPLTVVMVWNIPVTPVGLTSPLCLHVRCKAPCYPARCFPQVLSTDRGQTNTHRTPITWWSVAQRGLQIPVMVHICSVYLSNMHTSQFFTGFVVSRVTNCLATTSGVIILTHRRIGCAQTLAEWLHIHKAGKWDIPEKEIVCVCRSNSVTKSKQFEVD